MRVLVIDEQPLFQEGVKATLAATTGMTVLGGAGHAREGLRLAQAGAPEVVLVNLALPGMSGLAVIRELRRRRPEPKILAVCAACGEREMVDAFAAGASGLIAKTDPPESFMEGVLTVARGERFLGPGVQVLNRGDALEPLSRRERDVLDLILKGFKNREMARELCISVKTVETHRLHINRKLDCSSAVDLLRYALVHRVAWSEEPTAAADDLMNGPAAATWGHS